MQNTQDMIARLNRSGNRLSMCDLPYFMHPGTAASPQKKKTTARRKKTADKDPIKDLLLY